MNKPKSYNKNALRGYDYDDKEFQADMAEVGVMIPDALLYTKEGPEFAIKHFKKSNEQGYLNEGMSPRMAQKTANNYYTDAMNSYKNLLKNSKSK
jgi:hypothetical protein